MEEKKEKRWMVRTPVGDYADIWAETAHAAKRRLWHMTLGRIEIADMVVVREDAR